jgi:hypothetical protein
MRKDRNQTFSFNYFFKDYDECTRLVKIDYTNTNQNYTEISGSSSTLLCRIVEQFYHD